MRIEEILRSRREEILKIAAKHGASNVRIFGSAARGEAGSQSDIDLLVDVGVGRTPFFPGGLLADLEELLGCRADVVTEAGASLVHPGKGLAGGCAPLKLIGPRAMEFRPGTPVSLYLRRDLLRNVCE